MAAPILKFKRGLLANLPALNIGEPGFTTDKHDLYVGSAAGNKLIGSGRFWTTETASTGGAVRVYEATANGTNSISFAAPANIAADVTYTFPSSPTNNYYLKTDGSGNLSWGEVVSDFTIAADSGTPDVVSTGQTITFAGTANEINTAVSDNQVTIGMPDNVIVGGALTVTTNLVVTKGASVGGALTVTGAFDANGGADISGGETVLSSATVSDLTSGRVVLAGTNGALQDSANLTHGGGGLVVGAGGVNVSGASTFSGGNVLISQNLTINGNLTVNGTETIIHTERLDVEDKIVGIASTSTPSDAGANGAGIEVYGDNNYTLLWRNATDSWEVNQNFSPSADDNYDLGRPTQEWRNLHVDGLAELDDVNVSSAATIATLSVTNVTATNLSGTIGTITRLNTTNLVGTIGTITTLNSTSGTITNLTGTAATITTLNSTSGTITNLTGTAATITTLNNTNGTITNLVGTIGTITTLNSTSGTITNLVGTIGTVTRINATNLSVTGVSTFTGAIDANGGADISGGETVLSSATVSDLTSGRVVLAGIFGSLEDSANLTYGGGGLLVGAGGINVTGVSTFSARVNINGLMSAIDVNVSGAATVVGNLKIGSLKVNDAAGDTDVIRYDGTARILENITVDAGAF
jgi:hypothetical protein